MKGRRPPPSRTRVKDQPEVLSSCRTYFNAVLSARPSRKARLASTKEGEQFVSVLFSKKADPRSFIRDRADKRKPPARLNKGQGGILAATPAYKPFMHTPVRFGWVVAEPLRPRQEPKNATE